jgi:hypothetical protein
VKEAPHAKRQTPKFRKRVASAVGTSVILLTGLMPAQAQPDPISCLPPQPPMTDLSPEVLAEYRAEIVAEFETYFSAISDHVACLDEERNRALDKARAATKTYTTLITTIPAAKDLP